MKILSLDTSGTVASVAILDENVILGEYNINHNKTHSQKLMPMVNDLLNNLELKPADIDIFSVSVGPGSFTGLRIGIATVKGMAQALNKPVIGIPTLDGLAFNLAGYSGNICPIIDARNDNIYIALYTFNKYDLTLNMHVDYKALHIDELLNILSNKEPIIFLGDGVLKHKEYLKEKLGTVASFAPSHNLLQRASSVGMAAFTKAKSGQLESYIDVLPLYLRASQAERLFKENCKM